MQPCLPGLQATRFLLVCGAWNGSGPAIWAKKPTTPCQTKRLWLSVVWNWMRMAETTKNSGEKLSVTPTKTLTLKRGGVEQGMVRQSFSHGRSKAVVVEKVKRRIGPGEVKAEPVAAP